MFGIPKFNKPIFIFHFDIQKLSTVRRFIAESEKKIKMMNQVRHDRIGNI